jgi:hypothetical protein
MNWGHDQGWGKTNKKWTKKKLRQKKGLKHWANEKETFM